MKTLSFVVAAALVSGATSTAQARGVEDADATKVAGCTLIKEVSAPTSTRELGPNRMPLGLSRKIWPLADSEPKPRLYWRPDFLQSLQAVLNE